MIIIIVTMIITCALLRPATPPSSPSSTRRTATSRCCTSCWSSQKPTANLCTKILNFRGFDSSIILHLGGGVLMFIADSPEVLSQQILVGIILVGRFGVDCAQLFKRQYTSTPLRKTIGISPARNRGTQRGTRNRLPLSNLLVTFCAITFFRLQNK